MLPRGHQMEVEIRMGTVVAVERMKEALENALTSVEVDWLLWQKGEESVGRIREHHRTLSIYY